MSSVSSACVLRRRVFHLDTSCHIVPTRGATETAGMKSTCLFFQNATQRMNWIRVADFSEKPVVSKSCRLMNKKKAKVRARLELATFCVWSRRDNHYTIEPTIRSTCCYRAIPGTPVYRWMWSTTHGNVSSVSVLWVRFCCSILYCMSTADNHARIENGFGRHRISSSTFICPTFHAKEKSHKTIFNRQASLQLNSAS
jgi:hypothetical protein